MRCEKKVPVQYAWVGRASSLPPPPCSVDGAMGGGGGLAGRATSVEGLQEVHRRFCEHLPESMLWIEPVEGGERVLVEPGALRTRDLRVGQHIAISPGAVPRFLEHFAWAYQKRGATDAIVSLAAAHHRFAWIHPFLDGNGRVARLMSHAMLLDALDTGGVWSIARPRPQRAGL